jgi:hypothetical protein
MAMLRHATMRDTAVQCSAVQCSAVQCSAVQCSAGQCSAVQGSAVQIRPLLWGWMSRLDKLMDVDVILEMNHFRILEQIARM